MSIPTLHNTYNSMASSVMNKIFDLRKESVRESMIDFENVEHRMEYVATVHGIEFINDSISTNLNSSWFALENVNKPIIWIVGGQDNNSDFRLIKDIVKQKVKAIVCLGKDNRKINKAFSDIIDTIVETNTMYDAVRAAYYLGSQGDVVLLSPACASFDLFENYIDRGCQFKEIVREL